MRIFFSICRRCWIVISASVWKNPGSQLKWPELVCIIQTRVIFLTSYQVPCLHLPQPVDRSSGLVSSSIPLGGLCGSTCAWTHRSCGCVSARLDHKLFTMGSLHFCFTLVPFLFQIPPDLSGCFWVLEVLGSLVDWRQEQVSLEELDCPASTTEGLSPAERSLKQSSWDALRRAFE